MYSSKPKYFIEDNETIRLDSQCLDYKIYVACAVDKDPETASNNLEKLRKLVGFYKYIISLNILLPDTDEGEFFLVSIELEL